MGSQTQVQIVRTTSEGDVVIARFSDPRIVGLVADLALAATRRRDPDPILADLRSGQRRALRRLAGAA